MKTTSEDQEFQSFVSSNSSKIENQMSWDILEKIKCVYDIRIQFSTN